MRLSNKQERELRVWEHFIPKNIKWQEKTNEDLVKFFEWSEQGKHRNGAGGMAGNMDLTYFNALREGKSWAGVHMQMYEDGVLDGSMPYVVILENQPREVVDFMKKEMFKGVDAELIEQCYETLQSE